MKIKGTDAAYQITFDVLHKLGLNDKEAYNIKKCKEVDVDNKVAKAVVKAGYAISLEAVKPKIIRKINLINKEEAE